MVRKLSYLFKIESEIDEKVFSYMINKLLQCLFKGFEKAPRTHEEIIQVLDEGWEKKKLNIAKERLEKKLCIVCGSDCKNPLGFPGTMRSFEFSGTKYKFYYVLCYDCNLRFQKNAFYASFISEDIKDINLGNLVPENIKA
jgi:hypothetical protein